MAIGKRLKKARDGIDREKLYPLADAIKMVKERAKSKFDETVEIAINLGVDPRHAGQIDFDRCIATPDMMPLVGRLGKVLGPRGMMPNPKIGTVTMDVTSAVKGAKGGSVEFRVEKAGIVQAGVGKASFSEDKLVENIRAFADAVQKAKPAGAKGTFVQRVAVSSTMGPGVKVDPSSVFGGGA